MTVLAAGLHSGPVNFRGSLFPAATFTLQPPFGSKAGMQLDSPQMRALLVCH